MMNSVRNDVSSAGNAPPYWEHFEHMADIGLRGFGRSIAQAFEQIALAMTAVITAPDKVRPQRAISIVCTATDTELLLVDWLNALIFEMAAQQMLFARFEVRIDGDRFEATAWGETVDRDRHQPAVEIKGATLTALAVREQPPGVWSAQCVVDV
ncbi:MAG TPA: archease [Rhodocyclaceae bacterium]|nr:archease [Rhodocyclaceae bacterium]